MDAPTPPLMTALGAELTIAQAAALREALLERIGASDDAVVLDLSEVAEIDSAGVQLMLAARRQLAAAERALQLHGASPAVREALGVFGLTGLIRQEQADVAE